MLERFLKGFSFCMALLCGIVGAVRGLGTLFISDLAWRWKTLIVFAIISIITGIEAAMDYEDLPPKQAEGNDSPTSSQN